MKLAVALPIFDRLEFIQRTVPALLRARGIEEIPIVVSADGPHRERPTNLYTTGSIEATRKFVSSALEGRTMKDTLWFRGDNVGMSGNIMGAVQKAFIAHEADAVIVLEDDVEVSRDFITLIRACLEHYKDNQNVVAVIGDCQWCGFNSRGAAEWSLEYNPAPTRCAAWWVSIGWAVWRNRWSRLYTEYGRYLQNPTAWVGEMHDRIVRAYPPTILWQIVRPLFQTGLKGALLGVSNKHWGGIMNIVRCADKQVIIAPWASRTQHIGWYGRNLNLELAEACGSTPEEPIHRSMCWREDWETEELEIQFTSDAEIEQCSESQGHV